MSHAPRERVSWNDKYVICGYRIPVTLHVSVWVEICGVRLSRLRTESRSTWACELKFLRYDDISELISHAPRERVSWNVNISAMQAEVKVTLHVSVWVEMTATSR